MIRILLTLWFALVFASATHAQCLSATLITPPDGHNCPGVMQFHVDVACWGGCNLEVTLNGGVIYNNSVTGDFLHPIGPGQNIIAGPQSFYCQGPEQIVIVLDVPNPPCPQPNLVMDYYEPVSGPGCNDAAVAVHLIPPVACYPNHGIFELWKAGAMVGSFEANPQGPTPWSATFTGLSNDGYSVKGRPNIADCPTFGELAVAGDPCQATVTATVDISSNDGPDGCVNNKVICSLSDPAAGSYSCVPEPTNWTAELETVPGGLPAGSGSAAYGQPITIEHIPPGTYKVVGNSNTPCGHGETNVTVVGPTCQSTLTQVGPPTGGGGIWCMDAVQVEFSFTSNACYTSWTIVEANTQFLGGDGNWSAPKGQNIVASVPAPQNGNITYTFLAYPDSDPTCLASAPVSGLPSNGCDGSLSSGLDTPLSSVGAEDAIYWFKLTTSSCANSPWYVRLDNIQTQAQYFGIGQDNSDTAFVSGLPPGSYSVLYSYAGDICQGTSGNITVPECVPTTFYADVDGDGFGDAANSIVYCLPTPPSGYTGDTQDTNDTLITYVDFDGDGFGAGPPAPGGVPNDDDPADNDGNTYPGALEACDGVDNDADGLVDAELPSGLVLHLPCTGNPTDIGPNAMAATVYNATLTTDRFGNPNKAYFFNGTNARIQVLDDPVLRPASFTLCAWVNMQSGPTQYGTIVAKPLCGSADSYMLYRNNSAFGASTHGTNGAQSGTEVPSATAFGQWHFLSLTFDDATNTGSLYDNGVLIGSFSMGNPLVFDGSPLLIGMDYTDCALAERLTGSIDEVMLFNRALSVGEVNTVYRTTSVAAMETQQYVQDADGDQYYSGVLVNACSAPGGLVPYTTQQPGDCDDASAGVNPAAAEVICNGIDEDCDGMDVPGPVVGGRSLAFPGNQSRVEIINGPGIQPTGSMTVECWARSAGSTWSNYGMLVNKSGSFMLHPRFAEKTMEFYVHPGGVVYATGFTPGASFDLTQWHHYAGTYNAATGLALLYIDGVQVAEVSTPGGPLPAMSDLVLGRDPCCGGDRWFAGTLDEVRLWNVERTACQIRAAMNTKVGPYAPGLMAYYDFDEPTATPGGTNSGITTLLDRAPAHGTTNGTLLSFSLTGTTSNWVGDHGTVPLTWYEDADGDGYGSTATAVTNPYQPCGFSCMPGGDCNDATAGVNPGATELCNGVDDDCDGLVDADQIPGLMLYMPFNGDASDASGRAHNGTVLNATLSQGHDGAPNGAYQFNGSNARIDVPDHADLRPPSLTHSVWIRYDVVPSDVRVISGKPLCGGWSNSYGFWFQNGQLCSGLGSGVTSLAVYSFPAPSTGQWHHAVLTFDDPSNVANVYIDNVLAGTFSFNSSVLYDGTQVTVGQDLEFCSPALAFNGSIDEVTLFDRALSASEVSTLYSAPPITALDIICYVDADGDGFGDPSTLQHACVQPPGTALVAGDCDDAHATVYPGATEICDGLDNDCNGIGDVFDQALEFDGVNDYVALPAGMNGGTWTQLTIEAWVNIEASTGNFQTVCAPSSESFAHIQLLEGSSMAVYTNVGQVAAPSVLPTPGEWHHVALTSKTGETSVYLDGQLVGATVTTAFSSITAPNTLSLGRGYANGRLFNGRMRDVRIWSVARTAAEIVAGMGQVIPPQADLVASYRCNQGVPNGNNAGVISLVDAAGNGNTGTLNNFALSGTASNWVSDPGPAEVCNNLDDDCDGLVDEGFPTQSYWPDGDGDGSGSASGTPVIACSQPAGHVANSNDQCDGDPLKTVPGLCGCGVADTDSDNDGTANCSDSCPNIPGVIGSICNDNSPNTTNDVVNASCVCIGTPVVTCTTDLKIAFVKDNTSTVTWYLHQQGTNAIVQQGTLVVAASTQDVSTCLADGCYYLRVTDDIGDGIGGGYILGLLNSSDRIIDNRSNFLAGGISQVANNQGFCLPLGTDRLISTSCDKLDWRPNEYIVANDNPAVTAVWNNFAAGSTQRGNSGYEMWWYDPNGGYTFRRFQSHATNNGITASATRACSFQINSWSGNQLVLGTLYNVRVRSRLYNVAVSETQWGKTCRFVRDEVRAQCPLTKLLDTPGNQYLSCGASRAIGSGGANLVHARVATRFVNNVSTNANKYQFRFVSDAGSTIIKTSATGRYFVNTSGLVPCKTYEVDVRASFDNGATYCDGFPATTNPHSPKWGEVCRLYTLGCPNGNGGGQNMADDGGASTGHGSSFGSAQDSSPRQLTLYPNPNNGEQLFLSIDQVKEGVEKMTVDIYDTFGKRVSARTIAVADGYVNTVLELNGELATGVYVVNIKAGDDTYTERLVIQP